ncbi:MAG: hypothetical protein NW216_07675 [Hyphomicrobium sp.]|nr:hypothetical protein [Hyphomicrobium sp.]
MIDLLRLVPLRAWILAGGLAIVALSIHRYGEARYDAGFSERDTHYQERIATLNASLEALEDEMAETEASEGERNQRALVDALEAAGSDQCRILPAEQIARLNAIR